MNESDPKPGAIAAATDALEAALSAGEFAPGAPLPAERTLALRLAVSRVTLRAALMRLEHRGLIAANPHGRGRVARARATRRIR